MLPGHSSYFATYESNSYNSPGSPDRALTSVFHPTHRGRARLSSDEASSSLPALPLLPTKISLYGSVKSTRVPTKLTCSSRSSSSSIYMNVPFRLDPCFSLFLSSSRMRYISSLSLLSFPSLSLSLSFILQHLLL